MQIDESANPADGSEAGDKSLLAKPKENLAPEGLSKSKTGHSLSSKKNRTQLVKALANTKKGSWYSHFLGFVRSQDVFGERV
jgi:hypothetical protein